MKQDRYFLKFDYGADVKSPTLLLKKRICLGFSVLVKDFGRINCWDIDEGRYSYAHRICHLLNLRACIEKK